MYVCTHVDESNADTEAEIVTVSVCVCTQVDESDADTEAEIVTVSVCMYTGR